MKGLRPALLAALLLLASACGSDEPEAEPEGPSAIVGTWEVVDEPDMPFSRSGQRYSFAEDSTLQIFRPRSLGPASTIFAVYDFDGDTLSIRSEFDAEQLVPDLNNDTLILRPVGSGRVMTLHRVPDGHVPEALPPQAPAGEGPVYTPPADVPPEDMPTN